MRAILSLLQLPAAAVLVAATDPRGPGNALFCAASSGNTCWGAAPASAPAPAAAAADGLQQLHAPAIMMEQSAAAEAFRAAAGAAANLSLVPSLAPIWERRPRAVGPLPPGSMWDVKCDALLGCFDTRLERPPILPDVPAGVPAGMTTLLWIQGRAIHGGDTYATLRNGSLLGQSTKYGLTAAVDRQSAHMLLTLVAALDGRPYNTSLSTAGCGPTTLFDNKPHQVAFLLDGAARLATLQVDDALCGPLLGWAGWSAGATAANLTHFWASYYMRGLSRLLVYPRTLLTSEVLASFYAGPNA